MSNGRVDDLAVVAAEVPARLKSAYPAPFAVRMTGRMKRPLGDAVGLKAFGVNLTTLAPGAVSALHHRHSRQEEFIYVLEGRPTLVLDEHELELTPGMCAGFPAGGAAHHLHNRSHVPAVYLEVGDRTPSDAVTYPRDDLEARMSPDGWVFTRKDGRPW